MDNGKRIIVNLLLALICVLSSCLRYNKNIDQIANYNDTIIYIDYSNAINTGFIVPSKSQTESGFFEFQFRIVNKSDETTKYHYKIYYQNESYKFNEINQDLTFNPLCEENFYGSYEDVSVGFKSTKELLQNEMITINDSIRIVGNPRDEKKFFGNPVRHFKEISKRQIELKVKEIKNNKEWYNDIVKKANNKGITVEKQLLLDAEYIINFKRKQGNKNNRWKRNVRTGNYSFLFVIVPEKSFYLIPDYIKYINLQNKGSFVNPYYYYKYGDGNKLENIIIKKLTKQISVKAKLPLTDGVWVPKKIIWESILIQVTSLRA